MHRFFIQPEKIMDHCVPLSAEDAAHACRVLRLRCGEEVLAMDGAGMEYPAVIESISQKEAVLRLGEGRKVASEPDCRVTLYQCLPKSGKLEVIVQKCVELGISKIVPVTSARCVVKLDQKDAKKKVERYQRVAYEAAKQSGRGVIPEVAMPIRIGEIPASEHELMLVPYEEERSMSLKTALRAHSEVKDIGMLIGPEGGLEQAEVDALAEKGGISVTLGSRILRTETAGMAALAMLLYELEG